MGAPTVLGAQGTRALGWAEPYPLPPPGGAPARLGPQSLAGDFQGSGFAGREEQPVCSPQMHMLHHRRTRHVTFVPRVCVKNTQTAYCLSRTEARGLSTLQTPHQERAKTELCGPRSPGSSWHSAQDCRSPDASIFRVRTQTEKQVTPRHSAAP